MERLKNVFEPGVLLLSGMRITIHAKPNGMTSWVEDNAGIDSISNGYNIYERRTNPIAQSDQD